MARREIRSNPDHAFIELRKKLGADGPGQQDCTDDQADGHENHESRVPERPSDRHFIPAEDPFQCRIAPSLNARPEDPCRQHGHQRERQQQRADQREAHDVRHGRKEAPLHALERKQRQIGGDDDQQREEDRALHFERRPADGLVDRRPLRFRITLGETAQHVLDHDEIAVHDDAEVDGAEAQEIGGHLRRVHTREGKQQR
jgi:hypothetical protein